MESRYDPTGACNTPEPTHTEPLFSRGRCFKSLRGKRTFDTVFSDNITVRGRHLVFLYRRRESTPLHIGIIASKKTGIAVVRNRIKRRIRAYFDEHRNYCRVPWDLICIARRSAAVVPTHQLWRDMDRLFQKMERWSDVTGHQT